MLYHTDNTPFWSYFRSGHIPLPAQLPRLVLADRFQPRYVRRCPVTQRAIAQLRWLEWEHLPATLADRKQGERLVPLAAYIGAYLVRLEQQLPTFGTLRRFLADHPGLIWALGFPATGHGGGHHPFDPAQSLPSQAHFTRKIGALPNELLQEFIDGQVAWLHHRLGYEYFHSEGHDGFAAVPLKQPGVPTRQFDEAGLPLCDDGFPMPVRKLYTDSTKAIMPHQRAIHACPLLFPEPSAVLCPLAHKQWDKGGCSVNLPTSPGARLRHALDRSGETYKFVYRQRTAVERIFSQAKRLGMERPKLRNQQAITNLNTLIYLLINLRALRQVLARLAQTG